MAETAARRGWHLAATRLRELLLSDTRAVEAAAAQLLRCQSEGAAPDAITAPTVPEILADLRQLGREFEEADVDGRNGLVVAKTDRIVLGGLDLGPFAVELHLGRLSSRHPDGSCFECVALEPNPAACNDSVTHPHVQGGALCAGEATAPISTALREGRVADAFCLIRAVLREYNPQSPYVQLADWEGVRCGDCDDLTPRDELCYCEGCERDVCDDCCEECRHACGACGHTVGSGSFDADSGLCPGCLEQREQDRQEEDHEQDTEEDHDDEQPPKGSEAGRAAAGAKAAAPVE